MVYKLIPTNFSETKQQVTAEEEGGERDHLVSCWSVIVYIANASHQTPQSPSANEDCYGPGEREIKCTQKMIDVFESQ